MKILPFVLLAGTTAVADCPPSVDITDEMAALVEDARRADSDTAGRAISAQMWQLWLKAPNAQAQEILDEGMRRRESYDFLGARNAFNRLTEYCPEYAEGYNQRAFVHYLTQQFDKALVDLDRALALTPNHVGAQSGRALTLLELGRLEEARAQLRAALENNPWLSERFLLSPGGALAEPGEDI